MSAFATSSVTKLACEPESERARSLIAIPDEFRIFTRDVDRRTVFISLSALKCPVVNGFVDSILLEVEFILE